MNGFTIFWKTFHLDSKVLAHVYIHCDIQAVIEKIGASGILGNFITNDNIISLDNYSSEIITIDYVKWKDNVSDSLIKDLTREVVEKSLKEMIIQGQVNMEVTLPRRLEIPRSKFKEKTKAMIDGLTLSK